MSNDMDSPNCIEMEIELLIVIDSDGKLVDVEIRSDEIPDPHGQGKQAREYLLQTLKAVSPLPTFPENSFAGSQRMGIPIQQLVPCRGELVRRKFLEQHGGPSNIIETNKH